MRALFDVNALIALHDPDHVHHSRATFWFKSHAGLGWATCPLTQNGCVRIMSQPGYSGPQPIATVIRTLQGSIQSALHQLWPDDISLLDAARFQHSLMHGHRQLTDLYLLGLAVKNNGRLVSFGLRVPTSAVLGATDQHLVIL